MMLGAILSWGFLWPYITTKAGDWYPADLNEHDFKGLFGYKVHLRHLSLLHVVPARMVEIRSEMESLSDNSNGCRIA